MSPQRVLVLGPDGPEQMATHLAETLVAMGHAARVLDVRPPLPARITARTRIAVQALVDMAERAPAVRARRFDALVRRIREAPTDLVLVTYDYFTPAEVARIRDVTRTPVVLWYPDTVANVGRAFFVAAPYDAVFLKDPFMVRAYAPWTQAPVFFLPEAFHPLRHRLPADWQARAVPYVCDVTTAGNLHALRAAVFRHLIGFDVRIWGHPGPPWLGVPEVAAMFAGRYVADEEKAVAFRAARIVLNTQHPTEIEGVNVRTFEIAGVGGFQLSSARAGLGLFFELGREVETFAGPEDLLDKVRFYLAHPEARAAIAQAGEARADRDHTLAQRTQAILDVLDGTGTAWPMPPPVPATPG